MLVSQAYPEVELLSYERDGEALIALFEEYFLNSIDEIRSAISGDSCPQYDYSSRFLIGIRSTDSEADALGGRKIISSCIVVEKLVKTHRIFEVVWLATSMMNTRAGSASRVFAALLEYAKIKNASAVLVTSTNRALSWWVSRKNCNLGKYIIRGKSRTNLKSTRLSGNQTEHDRNFQVLSSTLSSMGLQTQAFPTHSLMESLYVETVNRSRKGKPATVQTFRGLPYRYDIDQSNHVWFFISKHLVKHLSSQKV